MKKILSFFLAFIMLAGIMPAGARADNVTINVYNWGQYISDGTDGYVDVNRAFTEATGINVNYMTFESNETLYTKLKTGGSTYDIIIPSDYMISRLIEEDMLEKIDYSNIPNFKYVDEAYRNMSYDPTNEYSVPYTWGTVGVIYNKKYVSESDIGSWDLLWNENYRGKILMFSNPRDSFAIALSLLGYDVNTEDETELKNAAEKLREQRPLVQTYVMDQIYAMMTREEAWIGTYYAGDYLMMAEENENLGFYFPKEGYNLFVDACCIPKGCKNKAAAEAYINFLCNPEINGENLEYLGYSTPLSVGKQYMDPEVAESNIAYPDDDIIANGKVFRNLSAETNRLMDELWLYAKTQTDEPDIYFVICIVFFAALIGVIAFSEIRKRRRMAKRGKYFTK